MQSLTEMWYILELKIGHVNNNNNNTMQSKRAGKVIKFNKPTIRLKREGSY